PGAIQNSGFHYNMPDVRIRIAYITLGEAEEDRLPAVCLTLETQRKRQAHGPAHGDTTGDSHDHTYSRGWADGTNKEEVVIDKNKRV
ncbi:MAG: hypothetical protein P8Y00_00825, partial [Deltaproteobacteria bacterium]